VQKRVQINKRKDRQTDRQIHVGLSWQMARFSTLRGQKWTSVK